MHWGEPCWQGDSAWAISGDAEDLTLGQFGVTRVLMDAGFVAFRWIGRGSESWSSCEGSLGADPLGPSAQWAGPAPRPWSTAARQRGKVATARAPGTSGGETAGPGTCRIRADSYRCQDAWEGDRRWQPVSGSMRAG